MAAITLNNVTVKTGRLTLINTDIGASGFLLLYSGAQPSDASVAPGGTLLAQLACSSTFGTVTAGVSGGASPYLTASAITTSNAVASGTPAFARITTSGGTGVMDIPCGAPGSGAPCIVSPDTTTQGAPVSVTSLVISEV